MKSKQAKFWVRLPETLTKRLDKEAETSRRTRSAQIEVILVERYQKPAERER